MPKKTNSTSTKGWLARQIRLAQEDMKTWPVWMQRAARWEGGLAQNNKNKEK